MDAVMESPDTFTQLPVAIDPTSKQITAHSSDTKLQNELDELNKLHRLLLSLDTPSQVPPPPAPVKPQRSVQIGKMRESGNASFKKGQYGDAIKMYDLGIRMASERPPWEASGLVREELSALYGNRAQAGMALQGWAEAGVDARVSVELKRVGNVKGWWRRGVCLREMGLLEEAREWISEGLTLMAGVEAAGKEGLPELETLAREVDESIGKAR